ncbi:MAG: hypothetical protein JSU99_04980 [Nitrospiraceae bacterium]|nr:MAG: hypothetical protein JSU99_04980 [Nitrospiraceae bacterium]
MAATTYRSRLIMLYTALTFLIFLVLVSVFYVDETRRIGALTDNLLVEIAKEKMLEFQENPNKYSPNEVIEIFGKSYFKVVRSETGTVLKSFAVKDDDPYLRPEFLQEVKQQGSIFKTVSSNDGNVRLLFMATDEANVFQVALPLSIQEELLKNARYLYYALISVSAMLSFLVGWALSGRAVKPVIRITEDMHAFAEKEKKGRLDIKDKGVEFSNLALVFNSVLERVERFMENQRQFTADISHEIRSPLTAIKGNIEVTLRRQRTAEDYEETMQNSLAEINRIIHLINNMLFLSKVDTGGMEVHSVDFSISRLLERIVESKKYMIREKGLEIDTDWGELVYFGDEVLISRLFMNLLDNAISYTPAGGQISVAAEKVTGGINIAFQDSGVGIASREIERIFGRFYRIRKNLSMHESGSGLGLYLCRWIAKAHGGSIKVESEVHRGSTFTVFLPFN